MASAGGPRVLSDTWYGQVVDADVAGSTRTRVQRWLTTARMCRRSRDYDLILTSQGARRIGGLIVLAAYLSLSGQRKLILTEFMPGERRGGLKGILATLLYRVVLDHAVVAVQVMTDWERSAYARRYRIALERLRHVPFYWFDDRVAPADPRERSGVMASGRNSCDWSTYFAAVDGLGVPIVAVCTKADARRVLATAPPTAVVHVELERSEHNRLLASSELYVLALTDTRKSTGHVRLASAATFGTPVVASGVAGIRGYEHLAVAVVPPDRPDDLARTSTDLLEDPALLRVRADEVGRVARTRPYSLYVDEMRALILGSVPAGAAP